MVAREKPLTMEDFKAFVARPENSDRLFEFINGEIIEVTPGRTRYSEYHDIIVSAVRPFCREHNLPCHTCTADGAFTILGNTIAPDFAYKRTPMSDDYPDPVPPLWVVEIISPTDKAPEIRAKRLIYQQAGILLWEMYPQEQSVDVYTPGQLMRTVNLSQTLDGGDVLPGFTLPVNEIFKD
jgi:Uma2 family endonuclease